VLYVFFFSSLLMMFVDFFLSCQLRTHRPTPGVLGQGQLSISPRSCTYGNLNHPTHSNQDLLNPAVPSISRKSSNGSYEIRIEPPVSVQHPTFSSLHTNTN